MASGFAPSSREVPDPELIDSFDLPVESIKVREFSQAAWDHDPAHLAGDPVPPTFLGAAAQMMARAHPVESAGLDLARSFHGEERIAVHALVRVGDTLQARVHSNRLPDAHGRRSGRIRRFRFRSSFLREGEPVAVIDRVILDSEHTPAAPALPAVRQAFDPGLSPRADPLAAAVRHWSSWRPGEMVTAEFAGLTRTDFVRYAGASGDFTAVHFDDGVASRHGAPAAFAMGMLSGAFLGHVLADLFRLDGGFDFDIRFHDRVWPGDTLTVTARLESAEEGGAAVRLECARDDGALVTTASARLGLARTA